MEIYSEDPGKEPAKKRAFLQLSKNNHNIGIAAVDRDGSHCVWLACFTPEGKLTASGLARKLLDGYDLQDELHWTGERLTMVPDPAAQTREMMVASAASLCEEDTLSETPEYLRGMAELIAYSTPPGIEGELPADQVDGIQSQILCLVRNTNKPTQAP